MSFRIESKEKQIVKLKEIFKSLNPEVDFQVINFEGQVDEDQTFITNLLSIYTKYLTFRWFVNEEEYYIARRKAYEEFEEEFRNIVYELEELEKIPEEIMFKIRDILDYHRVGIRYSFERKFDWDKQKRLEEYLRRWIYLLKEARTREDKENLISNELARTSKTIPWPKKLEEDLKSVFMTTLDQAHITISTKLLNEFYLELEIVKTLETEEDMFHAIKSLAKEIIDRNEGRKTQYKG